jgi:hypothetical protein
MSRRQLLGMLALGIGMAVLAAIWVRSPGYLDADYYFATGRVLASGGGLRVPFLWNYLASGHLDLPQPALLYWMPLTSLLSAASLAVFGPSFLAGQLPSLAFTASLPVFTAWIAQRLGARPGQSMMAGGLAGFSGFYLPFFVTTDAFSSFAVIGGGALWFMAAARARDSKAWLLLGVLSGLGHLARADGLLLVVMAVVIWGLTRPRRLLNLAALGGGYLAVMGGWFLRMWQVAGGPLSPGGLKAAWLTNYNQLFSYPADGLTTAHWIESGMASIVRVRLAALGVNFGSLLLVNGLVFLTLLMALGLWRLRRTRAARITAAYLVIELAAMSIVFPFPGQRGGFFHSAAAAMPLLWAICPIGLDVVVAWLYRRWHWDPAEASRRLGAGAVLIAAAATLFLLATRQVLPARQGQGWGQATASYVGAAALGSGANPQDVVAANNPPAFWLASGHPSVVIPNGDPRALAGVVRDFGVKWVVLERNHPPGLNDLYDHPSSLPWLSVVWSSKDAYGNPVYVLGVTEMPGP